MNSIPKSVNAPQQVLAYVLLHGKYPLLRELLVSVRLQLGDLFWLLDEDKSYVASELCGYAYWQMLTRHERRLAGSCVAHLVRYGELPLAKVSASGRYPNKYQLRSA